MNYGHPGLHDHATACYGQPAIMAPNTGAAIADDDDEGAVEIPRCHLHTKPLLTCKFCRKYKSAVHHHARIAQQQEQLHPQEDRKHMVEMTNTHTFNMNSLLRENILSSEYFKSLYAFKTFSEVVDEIYQFVDHAEPYCAGNSRAPSTLFCCLYKLLTMKLTEKQIQLLLNHVDSPYIRCVGFLYLRYVHPAFKLWKWYEPYVFDDEEFTAGADHARVITMGEYVERLITEDKYFSTVLPRLPAKIKTQYGAQLIAIDEHRKRKRQNKEHLHDFVAGAQVLACSNGDWLEGVVIEVTEPHPGRMSCRVKLEDDTEEEIDLGLIVLHTEEENEVTTSRRSRSRSRDRTRAREQTSGEGMDPKNRRRHEHEEDGRRRSDERRETSRRADSPRRSSLSRGESGRSLERGSRRRSRDVRRRSRSPRRDRESRRDEDGRRQRRTDHSSGEGDGHRRGSDSNHHRRHDKDDDDRHRRSDSRRQRSPPMSDDRSRHRSRSVSRSRHSAERRVPQTQEELLQEFRRRESAKAVATGKDYARRPTSYKSSLSLKADGATARKRGPAQVATAWTEVTTEVKGPSGPSAEHKQKMARLMEKYTQSQAEGRNRLADREAPEVLRLG